MNLFLAGLVGFLAAVLSALTGLLRLVLLTGLLLPAAMLATLSTWAALLAALVLLAALAGVVVLGHGSFLICRFAGCDAFGTNVSKECRFPYLICIKWAVFFAVLINSHF